MENPIVPVTAMPATARATDELPAWQWPRHQLTTGRWMQARCQRCSGTGAIVGLAWTADCGGCVDFVADNYRRSGGIRTWTRYKQTDLTTFDWSRCGDEQGSMFQSYAANLEAHIHTGWGLVLTGAVGSGKTHLAVGLGVVALGLGFTVFATQLGNLLLTIREAWQPNAAETEATVMADVLRTDSAHPRRFGDREAHQLGQRATGHDCQSPLCPRPCHHCHHQPADGRD